MAAANGTGRDVELAAQLGHRLLARYDSLDRRSLELCAEDASAVCLPPVFAHGASRCILRPHGEQSKRGALQWQAARVILLCSRRDLDPRLGARWSGRIVSSGARTVVPVRLGLLLLHDGWR